MRANTDVNSLSRVKITLQIENYTLACAFWKFCSIHVALYTSLFHREIIKRIIRDDYQFSDFLIVIDK